MGFHRAPPLARGGLLDYRRRRVRCATPHRALRHSDWRGSGSRSARCSGGNLQKIVVARELTHEAPLLIAEQPTRGVDVGAIEFIHGF